MEEEKIKIVCPVCGAVLRLTYKPSVEKASIVCPVCKSKSPYTSFRVLSKPKVTVQGNMTQYDFNEGEKTDLHNEEVTEYAFDNDDPMSPPPPKVIGSLVLKETNKKYNLSLGHNIIGRQSPSSSATIQIPPLSSDPKKGKAMSREHIVIDVIDAGATYKHIISLYKGNVNRTFVDGQELLFGDQIVLHHGMPIKISDYTLRFVISDGDDTDF